MNGYAETSVRWELPNSCQLGSTYFFAKLGSKGFVNKLCIALFAKKNRKYPSNGFANKVCNLVNFANRG